jgi:hypothetical protein
MTFTKEYIQQLLIEKITGTIDADDDIVIRKLMMENEDILHQWKAIQQQVKQAEAQGFSIEGDEEKSWQHVALKIAKQQNVSVISIMN